MLNPDTWTEELRERMNNFTGPPISQTYESIRYLLKKKTLNVQILLLFQFSISKYFFHSRADECGRIISAISATTRNGAVWTIEGGQYREVAFSVIWRPEH